LWFRVVSKSVDKDLTGFFSAHNDQGAALANLSGLTLKQPYAKKLWFGATWQIMHNLGE
jgi:hypothetical protein